MFSAYLRSKQDLCRQLVQDLLTKYPYASVMGKQITGSRISVTTSSTSVGDTMESQCGFVVKVFNGKNYSEYSFSDISEEKLPFIEAAIAEELTLSEHLSSQHVEAECMKDEPMKQDFVREEVGKKLTIPEMVEQMRRIHDKIKAASDKIVLAGVSMENYEVSALFISENKELTQNYSWSNATGFAMAREGAKMQRAHKISAINSREKALSMLEEQTGEIASLAVELLTAENIVPGVYDIITAPSITGLIAHEAFGHGVEMDMFVKSRACSRNYIGKAVASELVNMHDGAGVHVPSQPSGESIEDAAKETGFQNDPCVGYFFDDDGVLAQDTLIIKNGILQTGISDAVSAAELGTAPTGNGRRQDPSRKAYSRMTNTYFAPGKDKLEDMIASIEHGYMLFDTSNGMEDPKNWNIQCVAAYGREIKDGKFTGKIVAPVVMSGYVPDLLKSISMVSDEWQIIGSGHCGKGYKEWVMVSDGGPYLKAVCKLG